MTSVERRAPGNLAGAVEVRVADALSASGLTAAEAATRFTAGKSVFYSPWVMLSFFAVLIGVSLASYRYLEMPAQRWLRQYRSRPAVDRPAPG